MATLAPATTVVTLPLARSYAGHWHTWEGLREYVQNWYDGCGESWAATGGTGVGDLRFEPTGASPEDGNAFVARGSDGTAVGLLLFNPKAEELYFVNKQIGLARKTLLLGYSKKGGASAVGQFGEGMKVGALALLREGKSIVLSTAEELWEFGFTTDPNFGEIVLAVTITDQYNSRLETGCHDAARLAGGDIQFEFGREDTVLCIGGLSLTEWTNARGNFLFLTSPQDSFRSELGTLILDPNFSGKVFVKGFFVCRLDGDLSAGCNLTNVELDRDRRAIVRPSEIEHQVSAMWVRAISARPALVPRFYALLKASDTFDSRHASFYIDATGASLLASQFFRAEGGRRAFPVNPRQADEAARLAAELDIIPVVVPAELCAALAKAPEVGSLDDLFVRRAVESVRVVPVWSLPAEQRDALEHGIRLADAVRPGLQLGDVDVVETNVRLDATAAHRKTVPRRLLDPHNVHADFANWRASGTSNNIPHSGSSPTIPIPAAIPANCPSAPQPCHCSAAAVCRHLLAATSPTLVASDVTILLAMHLAPRNPPVTVGTQPVTEETISVQQEEAAKAWANREAHLQKEIARLRGLVRQKDRSHETELKRLRQAAEEAEQFILREEVRKINFELEVRTHWDKRLLEDSQRHAERLATLEKTVASLEVERMGLLQQLKQVARVPDMAGDYGREEMEATLRSLSAEVAQCREHSACQVCFERDRASLLRPCGHFVVCSQCAMQLEKCPVCRAVVTERLDVFDV